MRVLSFFKWMRTSLALRVSALLTGKSKSTADARLWWPRFVPCVQRPVLLRTKSLWRLDLPLSLDRTETCSSDGNVNISSSPLGFYRFLSCWTLWIYAIICLWDDKKQNRERYLKLRDYTGRGKKPKASFAIVWIPIGHQSRSPLLAWWRRRSTGD